VEGSKSWLLEKNVGRIDDQPSRSREAFYVTAVPAVTRGREGSDQATA
jgi:hypothetical protein